MVDALFAEALNRLRACALPDAGFAGAPGGPYRPDATSWTVLALDAWHDSPEIVAPARRRLAASQGKDGRVSMAPDHADAWWPTAPAILAWRGDAAFQKTAAQATRFLLASSGLHWKRDPNDPAVNDTSLRGWSWIADTFSWVEPTSLAMLALDTMGASGHARMAEATALLLDRQLPSGGWNYGNSIVFGQELRPEPEATGVALDALAGRVPRDRVQASLDYLARRLQEVRTPLALGWGLLGLGAWGARPPEASEMIAQSLQRQSRLGPYDAALLGLLLVAAAAQGSLRSVLKPALP